MSDETVLNYLSDPENLPAALELEPAVRKVRDRIFESFWNSVESDLRKRLDESGGNRWKVKRIGSVSDKGSSLGLVDRVGSERKQFSFLFGDLGGNESGHRAYAGVSRGSKQATPAAGEESVRIALEGFDVGGVDDWWIRFAFLNDIGIPITRTEDNDSVMRLYTDNGDSAHPLAVRTAQFLWDLFEACHKDVEVLNDKYPYA